MKLLVVSQFFSPDITAAAFRIADTVTHVADRGHEVRVITARPHKAQVAGGAPETSPEGLAKVYRTPIADVGAGGLLRYVIHYASFAAGCVGHGVKLCARRWRPDVIWATSPPLTAAFAGRILAGLFRCPLVLDVRDIWPDSAVSAGQLSPGGWGYRVAKWMETHLYAYARQITCVAAPMRDYIVAHGPTPVTVIYNGVDARPDSFAGAPARAARDAGPRTILYIGNLGRAQALDVLIDAYADLSREGVLADWRLRLVGAGAVADELRDQIAGLDAGDRVRIAPPISRDAAMRETCRADLLFLGLKPDPVFRLTIPSKVFDYLLAAKPIVGSLVGEGREILESTGANLCCDPGSVPAVKAALTEAAARYHELEARAGANRTRVLERFTRDHGATTLIEVLDRAAAREPLRGGMRR